MAEAGPFAAAASELSLPDNPRNLWPEPRDAADGWGAGREDEPEQRLNLPVRAIFVPNIRSALDKRPSIAVALAETIKSGGVEAAVRQYRTLRALRPVTMNFDEDELNALGYDLLRTKQTRAAVRILQLNTEMYPASGNTWDSLGEAYMDDGEKLDAIANYRKSLAINPANQNAVMMLGKLGAQ